MEFEFIYLELACATTYVATTHRLQNETNQIKYFKKRCVKKAVCLSCMNISRPPKTSKKRNWLGIGSKVGNW